MWSGARQAGLQSSETDVLSVGGMILSWGKTAAGATLLVLASSAFAQTAATPAGSAKVTGAQAGGRKHGTSKPAPAPETPPPPPAPLTPEQMPPLPPQVTYNNGLLTIVATNSTLADILQAVSASTGASVDAPAHLTSERVAARLGPGEPREVLSDLLRGPRFDYILVGSDGDPNEVHSIILTPNQSSPSVAIAQAQARPAPPAQEEMDEEVEEEPAQPEPQPPPPPTQSPRHRPFGQQQPPDQTVAPPSSPSDGAQPPQQTPQPQQQPQVKTPEQLLEELRNLQQNPPQQNPPQQNPQQQNPQQQDRPQ